MAWRVPLGGKNSAVVIAEEWVNVALEPTIPRRENALAAHKASGVGWRCSSETQCVGAGSGAERIRGQSSRLPAQGSHVFFRQIDHGPVFWPRFCLAPLQRNVLSPPTRPGMSLEQSTQLSSSSPLKSVPYLKTYVLFQRVNASAVKSPTVFGQNQPNMCVRGVLGWKKPKDNEEKILHRLRVDFKRSNSIIVLGVA